jgi:hypothetical protein
LISSELSRANNLLVQHLGLPHTSTMRKLLKAHSQALEAASQLRSAGDLANAAPLLAQQHRQLAAHHIETIYEAFEQAYNLLHVALLNEILPTL